MSKKQKTIIIEINASWGFVGATRKEKIEMEVDEDATEAEIEKKAGEWAFEWACEYLDIGFTTSVKS